MKKARDFVFFTVLVVGVGVSALTGHNASSADYQLDREPEIVAATFESAWCSACKILKPRLAKVIPDFADKPVKFVDLNFTFGERDDIAKKAAAEGLADIYPRFKGATGFTLLVDRDTGEIVDTLTINYDEDAMRAAISRALAVAELNVSG